MNRKIITEGDDVLFFLDRRRSYLVKVIHGESLHTHKGYIKFDDIIERKFGETVKSNLGIDFVMFQPNINDYLRKMRHTTQVIYSKDIALIVNYSNIGPGSRIVEAGTGSGVLTSALAHYVRPNGKIYSYEYRGNFLERAQKNIQRAGLLEMVELKEQDVTRGISEVNVDAVILDMATPWIVVPIAYQSLKAGGIFISFSPTIEQTVKTTDALNNSSFVGIETIESIIRRMKVKAGQTRPETLMIGHTGYITRARKVLK